MSKERQTRDPNFRGADSLGGERADAEQPTGGSQSTGAGLAIDDRLEDDRLDAALSAIQAESPDVTDGCSRVRSRLQRESGWAEGSQSGQAAVLPMGTVGEIESELRSCDDYRQLLPAYYAKELSEARVLLLEDHVRHCVQCRRAAASYRQVASEKEGSERGSGNGRIRAFAIAAAFLATVFAGWFSWQQFLPAGQADLLQVKSVDGQLFALEDGRLAPLFPGDWVDGGREIRTAKDGGAVLELADGSRIEVNERASLEVVRKRSGYRVRVDHGDIIVEAAKQRHGTLDVTTDEMLVSVKGTIFAVSHGTKGSRVSVIEGEVQVEQARKRTALYPGDQLASRSSVTAFPLAQEIGWSGDVDRYLSILEEFGQLRESLNQVLASAQPRYSSELLEQVPLNTSVYIALPNPTATLADIYGLIKQRLAAYPALAGPWQQVEQVDASDRIDQFIGSVQELSDFLGEETVVALAFDPLGNGGSSEPVPMVLSQVENSSGLRAALEAKLEELRESVPDLNVVLLDGSTTSVPGTDEALYVYVANDLLVATPEIAEINRIAGGTSSGFVGSDFYQTVTAAYDRGAEYLGAVDLAAVLGSRSSDGEGLAGDLDQDALRFTGLGTVEYLVVERSLEEDRAHTAADLTFSGERHGMAAWLAAPAAMESLEFVSASATFASASVHKDPALILDEVFAMAMRDEDDLAEFERAEAEVGISFRDDLAVALGGEATVAIDGPLLPTPSWKVILEVYDERLLQATLETLVARVNEEAAEMAQESGESALTLTEIPGSAGHTFYHVEVHGQSSSGIVFDPSFTYAYVDGFLVAAPSRGLVEQAILYHESGASLVTSEAFQEILPRDGYLDFSAVVFSRVGETLSEIADQIPTPESMTAEQRQRLDGLLEEMADDGPSIYCLYGEADRIRLVSNSAAIPSLAGLSSLVGLGGLSGVVSGAPGI